MRRAIMVFLIIFFATNIWAADPKEIFISQCGSCHKRGGETSPVNPGDKAATVWQKYFKRKRHQTSLAGIPAADMDLIVKYLCDHAADSDQPEAAAIPR